MLELVAIKNCVKKPHSYSRIVIITVYVQENGSKTTKNDLNKKCCYNQGILKGEVSLYH
jgi:hypothetical protein